jgi:DNA-binding MarR family transcriptional regulator
LLDGECSTNHSCYTDDMSSKHHRHSATRLLAVISGDELSREIRRRREVRSCGGRYDVVEMGVATRSTAPSPIVLVPRLAKQIMRRSSDELLGVNFRLLVALSYLHDHDGAPQQELGDALSMDAGNVVLLLNELEDLGYVSRSRDPDDRRRHRVAITSTGRQAIDRARRAQDELEDDLLQALTPKERATLGRLLARAVQGVDDAYRQSAADQLAE